MPSYVPHPYGSTSLPRAVLSASKLDGRFAFAILELAALDCWLRAVNEDSLTESFVEAVNSVPVDVF
jgi:hypothetical protein